MAEMIVSDVLIGGRWVPAAAGTYPVIDPATEEIAGRAPEASVDQAREAARAAREAFEHGPWPHLSGAERGACLREAAARFRDAAPGLVDVTVAETGSLKPVAESQQVGAVALRLAKYAELAAESPDTPLTPREGPAGIAFGIAAREPVGVVACITPYNFPMTNCAGKLGPALVCGNTVVVKPAPVDPLCVAALCSIANEALPPGVVNLVCGQGPQIGQALR